MRREPLELRFERDARRGAVRGRAGGERVEQAQQLVARAPGRQLGPESGRDDAPADALALGVSLPGQQRRRARGRHRLEGAARAEAHRSAEIDEQPDRPLALLLEQLGVRATGARGHAPVDRAHVVARSGRRALRRTPCRARGSATRAAAAARVATRPARRARRRERLVAERDELAARRDDARPLPIVAAAAHGSGTAARSCSSTRVGA